MKKKKEITTDCKKAWKITQHVNWRGTNCKEVYSCKTRAYKCGQVPFNMLHSSHGFGAFPILHIKCILINTWINFVLTTNESSLIFTAYLHAYREDSCKEAQWRSMLIVQVSPVLHIEKAKGQIRLLIWAVWSGPVLFLPCAFLTLFCRKVGMYSFVLSQEDVTFDTERKCNNLLKEIKGIFSLWIYCA